MMKTSGVAVKGYRILPTSRIHVLWDLISIFAIMYYAVSCPVRFAIYFRSGILKAKYDWFFGIDFFLDSLFIFDIYLRIKVYAYISFESGRNEIIFDRDKMTEKYFASRWFQIDRIAVIPYDLLALAFGYPTIFRAPKIIRVSQIPSIIARLQRNLDDCMHVTMNESQVSGVIMFLFSFLIVVWSSAGWNSIRDDESAYESVYWAFTTLTTVGYGDFVPTNFSETCYALIVGALGATCTAAIIANVTSFFHDVDVSEDNIDHKVNCIKVN